MVNGGAGALTFDKMRVLQKLDPSPDARPLEIAGSFQMAKLHSFAVTGSYAVSEQVFDEYDRVKLRQSGSRRKPRKRADA